MIEAAGRHYWPGYFRALEDLLAPRGRIGLPAMTMRHDRMIRTSTTYTWIDKYIFPARTTSSAVLTAVRPSQAGQDRASVKLSGPRARQVEGLMLHASQAARLATQTA
jgi:cyclopropane-fatty-acyl-phospholipid synthase